MKTTNLKISGMTCNSCVSHVEDALRAVHGVKSVAVDLQTGRAKVEQEGVDEAKLCEVVVEEGYEAELEG